jgi:hypothetical protein
MIRDNELDEMWKNCGIICLEELRKTKKNLSQDTPSSTQDFNQVEVNMKQECYLFNYEVQFHVY